MISEARRKALAKASKIGCRVLRERALADYYANPSICKFCGSVIEVKENQQPGTARKKKFCNHSCAAKYNNLGRTRKRHPCLCCGEETKNLKYCNVPCAAAHRMCP